MSAGPSGRIDPSASLASAVPAWAGRALFVAAVAIGALLALFIAQDESYDPTQVFSVVVAAGTVALAAAAFVVGGGTGAFAAGLASGLLFFGGALLWGQDAGRAMLVCGALALAGIVFDQHRREADLSAPIGAFFVGLGAVVAAVFVIILTIEG